MGELLCIWQLYMVCEFVRTTSTQRLSTFFQRIELNIHFFFLSNSFYVFYQICRSRGMCTHFGTLGKVQLFLNHFNLLHQNIVSFSATKNIPFEMCATRYR